MFIKVAGAFTIAFVVVLVVAPAGSVRAARQRSTRDGVYTEAEAGRGKETFNMVCAECHGESLWGSDWSGDKTLLDVFTFIITNMPETNPGSLNAPQVREVIAFLLQANKLPPGKAELPTTDEGLKAIRVEPAAD
jgi:mono/diheme cytochrome c family protein